MKEKTGISINGTYVEYIVCAILVIAFVIGDQNLNPLAHITAVAYSFWSGLVATVLAFMVALSGKINANLTEKELPRPKGTIFSFNRFVIVLNMMLMFGFGFTLGGWLAAIHLVLGIIFILSLRYG